MADAPICKAMWFEYCAVLKIAWNNKADTRSRHSIHQAELELLYSFKCNSKKPNLQFVIHIVYDKGLTIYHFRFRVKKGDRKAFRRTTREIAIELGLIEISIVETLELTSEAGDNLMRGFETSRIMILKRPDTWLAFKLWSISQSMENNPTMIDDDDEDAHLYCMPIPFVHILQFPDPFEHC